MDVPRATLLISARGNGRFDSWGAECGIYVQGFIIHEEDGIKYELTPEIANVIVKAINDINLEECELVSYS